MCVFLICAVVFILGDPGHFFSPLVTTAMDYARNRSSTSNFLSIFICIARRVRSSGKGPHYYYVQGDSVSCGSVVLVRFSRPKLPPFSLLTNWNMLCAAVYNRIFSQFSLRLFESEHMHGHPRPLKRLLYLSRLSLCLCALMATWTSLINIWAKICARLGCYIPTLRSSSILSSSPLAYYNYSTWVSFIIGCAISCQELSSCWGCWY